MKNLEVPILLSSRYGLRSCEIVEKNRLTGHDPASCTITVLGKGSRERKIHLKPEDYEGVISYYLSRKKKDTITYNTLYNHLKPQGRLETGHKKKTVTHLGRKKRYEQLPDSAPLELYLALGEELGHNINTAMKHYNRKKIEENKKKLLTHL